MWRAKISQKWEQQQNSTTNEQQQGHAEATGIVVHTVETREDAVRVRGGYMLPMSEDFMEETTWIYGLRSGVI